MPDYQQISDSLLYFIAIIGLAVFAENIIDWAILKYRNRSKDGQSEEKDKEQNESN